MIRVTDENEKIHRLNATNWTVEEDGSLWVVGGATAGPFGAEVHHIASFPGGRWVSVIEEPTEVAK